jgi:hypothetical protein
MSVCDSVGNYILFETGSRQPTKRWVRAESSGTDTCGPRVHEKLKYTVLKNPPATVKGVIKSCLTTSYTIRVGKRLYAIDPTIYTELTASIAANPVNSFEELQARIKLVRIQTNHLSSIGVQLSNVPLSQYRKRYTYASTLPPEEAKGERKAFDFGYVTGSLINSPTLEFLIDSFRAKYPNALFAKPQFIYAKPNEGCEYKPMKIKDLYPGGAADRFGTPLLSIDNLNAFRENTLIQYKAMFVFLSPDSNRASGGKYYSKTGVVIGFDSRIFTPPSLVGEIAANSELIFVAVQSRIQKIFYSDYPPGIGLELKATNGGSDNPDEFEHFVLRNTVGMNNSKQLAYTASPFIPRA